MEGGSLPLGGTINNTDVVYGSNVRRNIMLSDLTFCKTMKTYVFVDQTKQECSTEHECPEETNCPLEGCFAEPPKQPTKH